MNRISKRTDRRALISGVEMLEGRKLMAAGETAQIVSGPLGHPTGEAPQREIADLKLSHGRHTGSFDLAANSPLVATIKKAISEGRKSVEVEFRVDSAKGQLVDEVLKLHFTSIAPGMGGRFKDPKTHAKDVDHVEFTFTESKILGGKFAPGVTRPGMDLTSLEEMLDALQETDPLGFTSPKSKDPHPTLKP